MSNPSTPYRLAPHLTCNQAVVLMNLYRGSDPFADDIKTTKNDIRRLEEYGYVETDPGGYITSMLGEARVASMLQ